MKNLIILFIIGSLYIGCVNIEVNPEPSQPKEPIEPTESVESKELIEPAEPEEGVKAEILAIPENPDVTVPEIPKQEESPQKKADEDKG